MKSKNQSVIVPILSIIFSALCTTVSIIALTLICIATDVPQLAVVAIPFALVSAALTLACGTVTVFFRKNKLCRAAFFIDLSAFILSAIAIIVWFAVL